MSNATYVCCACGSLRRRPKTYASDGVFTSPVGPGHPDWPRCCGEPMLAFVKAFAEAATKLDDAGRVEWIRRGAHVVGRAGRRWEPALTDGEIRRAREQWPPYTVGRRRAS